MRAGSEQTNVISVLPRGSGAERVHETLSRRLAGYRLVRYTAALEYCPPLLLAYRRLKGVVTHAPPDHAALVAARASTLFLTFHNYVLDEAMTPYCSVAQRIHYATDVRYFIGRALERAGAVSAVSHATADLVREDLGYAGRIEVIPNGVDTRTFRPARRAERRTGPLRVLFSGNPSRRKGAMWLPVIADILGGEAEIVVTGGLRSSGASEAAPGIRFLGRVEPGTMPDLYGRFDVLLAPTVREGMSLSVLEAMASGLPVVASDIPSMREIVDPERGGILCQVGDVEAFARALRRLASNPALRGRMGSHNRARVEREYTVERMTERYREAFARVAEDRDG